MRGPKLVGYPPTGLRWSGDSSRLYFEWRQAGRRRGVDLGGRRATAAQPRKLTDEERRSAPPVNGRWDTAHRRVLFVDRGDIVLLDTVAGTRRQITRTTGNEANPRWARRETAVTFTRDNNLFIVPLDSGEIAQLTDVAAAKRDPRDTDSQKFIKAEEQKLIEHTRDRGGEEEEGRGEGQGARAAEVRARRSPVGDRPAAVARRQARLHPRRRARARPPSVPTCRTTSPSRATPRTSRRARSSATRRTTARWRS